MTTHSGDESPIHSLDDLLAPFHEACKHASAFRVGTEAEKFGLLADTLEPLPFAGPRSIEAVLIGLSERFAWRPEREHEGGEVISLRRGEASITLEPAGQLELSGAPHASVHETCKEFRTHVDELSEVSRELGIVWLSLGFHPFARHEELPHVPKLRYGVMERYLPTRGARALDMMRRTCTVQANLDYASEEDAMRKLRVALALQPVVTAMFANSPFYEGRRSSRLSERADVWLHMDPDRSGILPFAWERDASFQSYVEWALDVPMFILKRDGRTFPSTHLTFREFLRDGAHGERATMADWKMHLNTLFPEARLKNTLEMRGADAQPKDLLCAQPALWKGLFDDAHSLAAAERMIGSLDAAAVQRARPAIAELGLAAVLGGRPVRVWAEELLDLARQGLERLDVRNERGQSEAVHLERLTSLVATGRSPAHLLLERVGSFGREAIAQAARIA